MYYATIANIYFDRPRIPCEIETIFRSAISRRRPMNEYSRNERARVTKSLERERGEVADIRCGMVGGKRRGAVVVR